MDKLEKLQVIDSSGCHRYQYWNEQFLFDGREDTGWCSPSRSKWVNEYLIIDLGASVKPKKIRMLSRAINENAGFPQALEIYLSDDAKYWELIFKIENIQNQKSTWHEWLFDNNKMCKFVKILITKVGKRKEKKYFTQFMGLEIYTE